MIDETLRKIADYQMLHASFNPDIGLLNGRMGIILFFFHYARHTGYSIYEDFASSLLDDLCDDISIDTPINFADGLCGIAWGITYLCKQGFIDNEPYEILSDIDNRIMERDILRITDNSFEFGFEGLALYISERLRDLNKKYDFDVSYLNSFNITCNNKRWECPKSISAFVFKKIKEQSLKGDGWQSALFEMAIK